MEVDQRGTESATFASVKSQRDVPGGPRSRQVFHAPQFVGLTAQQLHRFQAGAAGFYRVLCFERRRALCVHHIEQRARFRVQPFTSSHKFGHEKSSEL